MGALSASPAEAIEKAKDPREPLKHLFCPCQSDFPGGQRLAYCGVRLAGINFPAGIKIKPVDLCVICSDLRESGKVCEHCGRAGQK